MVARAKIRSAHRVQPSIGAKPNEVVVPGHRDVAPIAHNNLGEVRRRLVPGEGCDGSDDGLVGRRIDSRDDVPRSIGHREPDGRPVVVGIGGAFRQSCVHQRTNRFDGPRDVAEIVLAPDQDRLIRGKALARPRRPEEDLVVEPLADPVDQPFDRLRLVPGRLERRDELEVRHP